MRTVAAGRGVLAQKNDRNKRCFVNFSWSPPNCPPSSIKIRFLRCFDDFLYARSRSVAEFQLRKTTEAKGVLLIFHGRRRTVGRALKISDFEAFWRFFGRPVAHGRGIWAQKNDRNNRCFVYFSWSPPNCRPSCINIRFLRCFGDFLVGRSRPVAKFGHKKNDRNHRCFVNFVRSPTKPSIEL